MNSLIFSCLLSFTLTYLGVNPFGAFIAAMIVGFMVFGQREGAQ